MISLKTRSLLPLALLLAAGTAHADNMLLGGDDMSFEPATENTAAASEPAEPLTLRERREQLAKQVDKEMGMTDMLITVVAPGGLLYAAHQEVQRREAAEELARIDAELARRDQEGTTQLD